VLEYAWNAASQLTQMKLTIRTQSAKTWDYAYLDDGELDTVTNPDADVTDHQYLSDGRLKKIVLDSTATREYFYQDTNDSHAYVAGKNSHLRKTLDKTSAAATICSFAYELDAAGIRRSITDKDSKYRAFGYDPKYQLKAETFWSAKVPGTRTDTLLWSYDGNGNRLTQHAGGVLTSYVYGLNNEMTDAGADDFTYDHFGNTASIVGDQAFTYNFDNCMTQLEFLTSEAIDNHEYDGNMRRMRSKFNSAANWTNYIHDELTENLICEYTLISGTYSIKALNTYGLGLISSNRNGTIRYFHFDGLGTTYHLSDTSQNVTDSYTYDAFGNALSATGTSTNPYRYVGQWGYYDDGAMGSSSGMLLLGVRYYWPQYGRFTTWDLMKGKNLYYYGASSPAQKIDPDGKECGDPPFFYWPPDTGWICIECSCVNKIGVWIIPEDKADAAFPAKCDRWYRADGFVIGGRMYKIDGGSEHVFKCQGGPTGNLKWWISSRQRVYAADQGKRREPYFVEPGRFGNEPCSGELPPYVAK